MPPRRGGKWQAAEVRLEMESRRTARVVYVRELYHGESIVMVQKRKGIQCPYILLCGSMAAPILLPTVAVLKVRPSLENSASLSVLRAR